MTNDKRMLATSGIDETGIVLFERVLEDTLTFLPNAMKDLEELLNVYPSFTLGWIFKAYSQASDGRRSTLPSIAAMAVNIENTAVAMNQREKLHLIALQQWAQNNLKAALDTWQHILSLWPLDIIAYRQFTGQAFWFGQKQRALQVSLQVLPYWDEKVPGYWMFAAAHAFALEEMGEYQLSEIFARQTLAINQRDLIAKHTIAHIFEMQGRTQEGIDFLQQSSVSFSEHNAFRGHLWWHLALFHLEQGEPEQALALFDQQIYPQDSSLYLDIQNAASLLARLDFVGVDVGERWHKLLGAVKDISGDSSIMFTELHNAMVLAKVGEIKTLEANINQIINQPFTRQEVELSSGTKIMQAIAAYHQGEFLKVIELMEPVRELHYKLGGSHAQQDVISQFLLMAYAQLKQWDKASSLLKHRYIARSQSGTDEYVKQKFMEFDRIHDIDVLLPHLVKVI
ncbi:tetratricopeptide repeat protein [Vibrio sagamiensis]|uniref:Tetratricopeptide repeat protein 38 n=1 Tax=Vibrio sagamiensis NBRC 104589 TaxID=1219064 RepID=A0A511QEL5_9VIBR|nr:tetratricopeptide repeat protein [Vibrio sagamiensis]GEM75730.1 tetratricopeptide repeat protein 38 family protein [Vibrio sagamiensis NBRC 104589]